MKNILIAFIFLLVLSSLVANAQSNVPFKDANVITIKFDNDSIALATIDDVLFDINVIVESFDKDRKTIVTQYDEAPKYSAKVKMNIRVKESVASFTGII